MTVTPQVAPIGGAGCVRVGTAGWAIPRASAHRFDAAGTHLQRYARQFTCVEINSCFYRPHAWKTYVRWRESTPADFQFAVKLPRRITHELKLQHARDLLVEFLEQTAGLAEKRGPILVQLPPSFAFDATVATPFFETVRSIYDGPLVFEPRHATWFASDVEALLVTYRIARVAADPPPAPQAGTPGGWPALTYVRWHGSPRVYWSPYGPDDIAALAREVSARGRTSDTWCIFDNTALGAAIENAWDLRERLTRSSATGPRA